MTIKQWFHKHTNVTLILMFCIMTAFIGFFIYRLEAERWGWAVWYGFLSLIWAGMTLKWWEEKQ